MRDATGDVGNPAGVGSPATVAPAVAPTVAPLGIRIAASSGFCTQSRTHTASEQDRMLRFAALVREQLEQSGESVALVSRSGLNLDRFAIRFSHAGIALRDQSVPWSVRQLYFACDEGRPLIFDQGLSGFVMNGENPDLAHLSLVFLPPPANEQLVRAAASKTFALRLLAHDYSAIAYPYSTRYQNCNQWVVEMLATGWAGLDDGPDLRTRAQAWLQSAGYDPAPIVLSSWGLRMAAGFVPLIHLDDHPLGDATGLEVQTSLPVPIETFVRQQQPAARRIELCHDQARVVIRQGWEPIEEGCRPGPADQIVSF